MLLLADAAEWSLAIGVAGVLVALVSLGLPIVLKLGGLLSEVKSMRKELTALAQEHRATVRTVTEHAHDCDADRQRLRDEQHAIRHKLGMLPPPPAV